jgi:glutathione S-transferase
MKLYLNPVAAYSRPLVLFVEGSGIDAELVNVDVFGGACQSDAFIKMNPNKQIPVLEDDGFWLTECAAILRYLANKTDSPTYPKDLRHRAKVDEALDWFNTGFARDFQYNFVYPQILPNQRRPSEEVNRATIAWGREKARDWMTILDTQWLGKGNTYLTGNDLTIADYFASGGIHVGELIGEDFASYPNVARWLQTMKTLPGWQSVDYHANGLVEAMKGPDYVTLG